MKKYFMVGLMVVMGVVVSGCGKKTISEKVDYYLEKEGYKTFFSYGVNDYDKDYKCYDYNYNNAVDCKREIRFEDYFKIFSKEKDKEITAYVYLDDNGVVSYIVLHLRKYGDSKSGVRNYIDYYKKSNGEDEYYETYETSPFKLCKTYVMLAGEKYDEDRKLDGTCTSIQDKADQVKLKEEFEKETETYDLEIDNLFEYYEWYSNKYVKDFYNKNKNNTVADLNFNEVYDMINDSDFELTKFDKTTIKLKGNNIFNNEHEVLVSASDKGSFMIYINTSDMSEYIMVYEDNDDVYGKSGKCIYNITKREAAKNSKCSTSDETELTSLNIKYEIYVLDELQLRPSELIKFAKEYLEN